MISVIEDEKSSFCETVMPGDMLRRYLIFLINHVIVYAKPNAGVSILMIVAKKEFNKLTKSEMLLSGVGQMTSI